MLRRDAVLVGVDGTKGGWVAVALDDGGSHAGDDLLRPIESEFAELWEADVIAIDVPIGYGPREADRAARAFLRGGPAGSVFTVPSRAVVCGALAESTFRAGLGVSAQLHGIAARIAHVTALAEALEPISVGGS